LTIVWMYNICDSEVFSAVHDQLASLERDAQLTYALFLYGS